MISLSKIRTSSQVIGHCFFILNLKIFKEFQTHWLGPCENEIVFDNGVVRIKSIDEEKTTFLVNGHRLRIYHKPLTKEEFIRNMQDNLDLNLVKEDSSSSPT